MRPSENACGKRRAAEDDHVRRTSRNSRSCASDRERRLRLDALCNDDFHHSAMVAMTGRNEAYYTTTWAAAGVHIDGEVRLSLQDSVQVQKQRGHADSAGTAKFVTYIQNHDQIAIRPWRTCAVHDSPGRLRR